MARFSYAVAAAAIFASLAPVPGSRAASSTVAPTWEVTTDGGLLADDVTAFIETSDVEWNAGDRVYVAGDSFLPNTGTGALTDRDVLVTAHATSTGTRAWSTRFDNNRADDHLVDFHLDGNNNIAYAVMNSGSTALIRKFSAWDGKLVTGTYPGVDIPGTRANDAAVSYPGGWIGITGSQGGGFYVTSRGAGNDENEFEDVPVSGEGLSADIPRQSSTDRTMMVTGRENVFGSGGDIYTAGYRYDVTGTQSPRLWSARWSSPTGGKDEGVASELAHVSSLGHRVAFVAGRSYSSAEGFDTVVLAYDHRTGAPLWAGDPARIFRGAAKGDDEPLDLRYSDKTGILYVLATSERGFPHGEDVAVLSYDARTGEHLATAYVSGDISNGDDRPRGIEVSPDGSRVLVAADVHNLQGTGGRRAGVFAFDADLHPAGAALLSSNSLDAEFASGVDFVRPAPAADVVVSGASRTPTTGYDQHVARYPIAGFAVAPVKTSLVFTPATPSQVLRGSTLHAEVTLREADGRPARDRDVALSFAGQSTVARTNRDGVAVADFATDVEPGTYDLRARFAGAAPLLSSEAVKAITVANQATTLQFTDTSATSRQHSDTARVEAVLEAAGSPVEGADVTFAIGDRAVTAVTDATGLAAADILLTDAPGNVELVASFGGSADLAPSSAATTIVVTRDDSNLHAVAEGSGIERVLVATLTDGDSGAPLAGRRVDVTDGSVLIGTAVTNSSGVARVSLPPGIRKHQRYVASFAGDGFYVGSSATVSS